MEMGEIEADCRAQAGAQRAAHHMITLSETFSIRGAVLMETWEGTRNSVW